MTVFRPDGRMYGRQHAPLKQSKNKLLMPKSREIHHKIKILSIWRPEVSGISDKKRRQDDIIGIDLNVKVMY
jgi:hypothetical protein